MIHPFFETGSRKVGICLAGLWLAACGGQTGGNPLDIADKDKQAYRMDCQAHCDAAFGCTGQDPASCLEACESMVEAGALQSAYVDSLFDCATGLTPPCTGDDLHSCIDLSLAQCARAANLDAFLADYCDRFHTCLGYDPETWRASCVQDMETSEQIREFVCTCAAGVEKLAQCVADAACQQIENVAVIDLCMEIYR